MRFQILFFPLLLLIAALPARAQEVASTAPEISLTFGGTVQARGSYIGTAFGPEESQPGDIASERREDEGLGFALRRVRLRMDASIGERFLGYINLGGASGTVELLDAYAGYRLTDALTVRIGRMGSAQPGGKIISHTRISGFERPFIVRAWESGTRDGDARALGVDLHYATDRVEAYLFLHSGGTENFRPEIDHTILSNNRFTSFDTGMAVSGYAAFMPAALPGVEVGGFAEYSAAKTEATRLACLVEFACTPVRNYFSYAGHVYWGARPGSQPFRAKLDVIGVKYLKDPEDGGFLAENNDQHMVGISLLGAVKVIDATEIYARVEQFHDGIDLGVVYTDSAGNLIAEAERPPYRFLSAGINFSPSALLGRPYRQARLTFGYSTALNFPEEDQFDDVSAPNLIGFDIDQHLFVLQAQLVF